MFESLGSSSPLKQYSFVQSSTSFLSLKDRNLLFVQVTYVSSSSTFTTHPCPMERVRLMSSDVMILCSLTNAPSANPDTMLGELCGRLGMS